MRVAGFDDGKEAETENPRKGVFFKEEEEKGFGDGDARNSEDEEHCIAISQLKMVLL